MATKTKKVVNYLIKSEKETKKNLKDVLNLDESYDNTIDTVLKEPNSLRKLKEALSDVNNIMTIRLTLSFVKSLKNRINQEKAQKKVKETNPNANGYDFQYDDGKILAEVKCNIPCVSNGKKYGSQQINAILNDFEHLSISPKISKTDINKKNILNYFKFMVLLDRGKKINDQLFDQINRNNRIKKWKEKNQLIIKLFDSNNPTELKEKDGINVVYVVFCKLDDADSNEV